MPATSPLLAIARCCAELEEEARLDDQGCWEPDFHARLSASLTALRPVPPPSLACAPGCPGCCVLHVAALPCECFTVAAWLKNRLDKVELAALSARLERRVAAISWMEERERIARQLVCAFLSPTGSCLIHPVRPLACRAVTSTDRHACHASLAAMAAEEEPSEVIMDLLQRQFYDQVFIALARRLAALHLDDRSLELQRGVLAALRQPQLGSDYARGARLDDLHG